MKDEAGFAIAVSPSVVLLIIRNRRVWTLGGSGSILAPAQIHCLRDCPSGSFWNWISSRGCSFVSPFSYHIRLPRLPEFDTLRRPDGI